MSDNVISLVPKKETQPEVNSDCVAMFERMLELAKDGKVTGACMILETTDPNHPTITTYSDGLSFHLIIAGMRLLEYRMLKKHDDESVPR